MNYFCKSSSKVEREPVNLTKKIVFDVLNFNNTYILIHILVCSIVVYFSESNTNDESTEINGDTTH